MSLTYAAHLPRMQQTANPWPTLNEAISYGKGRAIAWFEALIAAEGPARPYPAAAYAPKPILRIDTAKLPVFTLAFWREEQIQEQRRFEEEWALADRQIISSENLHAFAESPWPGEQPLTRKQRLSRWLDAHRGALKPWGRKTDESWLR